MSGPAEHFGAMTGSGHRRDRGLVLAYHRVADVAHDVCGLCVRPDSFRAQMIHLRDHYDLRELEEVAAARSAGPLRRPWVAVTFDDGYRDALDASELLVELGIPATFFLLADPTQRGREPFWEDLIRIFFEHPGLPPELRLRIDGASAVRNTATAAHRRKTYEWLAEWLVEQSPRDRADVLEQLADWSGRDLAPRESHRLLTTAEVRTLASRPAQRIGAHTRHHLCLTTQVPTVQWEEIVTSRQTLEELAPEPVRAFCYPYGRYDQELTHLVERAGYIVAVSCDRGCVTAATNRMAPPRLEVRDWGASEFAQRVRSALDGTS